MKAQKVIDIINESRIEGFSLVERYFSPDAEKVTIGLANIHAQVPNIEANKAKIVEILDIFKDKNVNIAIFPEFCLAGYFWDEEGCWEYMEQAVIENHTAWVDEELKKRLSGSLEYIIFNNIRRGPEQKYLNSTFLINNSIDYMDPENIYDKTFLPGIEKKYTETGTDDTLVVDTRWGKFAFSTCYDFCFSQIFQEYAMVDKVDAVIQMASWRGTAERDYPGMNVNTDTYYGDLWDMLMPATAARNQISVISCNAVGTHGISGAKFHGGSGIWAPSGLKMIQGSNTDDELIVVHNVDIIGERQKEKNDFDYSVDFDIIYDQVKNRRAFSRVEKSETE